MAVRNPWLAVPLLLAACSTARGTEWAPRTDVGVAAVDARTGKVLWEAWRPDELPADASAEVKTAAEYLLQLDLGFREKLKVTALPDLDARTLKVKTPFEDHPHAGGAEASAGKNLIYYRQQLGLIALDRNTQAEVWRLETHRFPYPGEVLEAGENLTLIQIGSHVPLVLHSALSGGGKWHLALPGLEPHTLKQRAAAAALLHHYGDGYMRPEVKKLADELRQVKDDPTAAKAATALEKLLADWPKARDRKRLASGGVAALLGENDDNPLREFAWKDGHRVFVWCLLQELLFGRPREAYNLKGFHQSYDEWKEQPLHLSDARRKKLIAHCRELLAGKDESQKGIAASVLLTKEVGWADVTDAEFKELFLSPHPSAWRWAALALSVHGRRKDLLAWAVERKADDQFIVIWLLNRDRKDWSKEELAFWLACAKRDAGNIAVALVWNWKGEKHPVEFREPIRDYLEKEIAKPTVTDLSKGTWYLLRDALTVLDSWEDDKDTPLIQDFLRHPGVLTRTRSGGEKPTEMREYPYRTQARWLLEKRGVKVPADVVYEEEVRPEKP